MLGSSIPCQEGAVTQLHRRFTSEQVKFLFRAYCERAINRGEIEEVLAIGKTRLFALLKAYRHNPQAFTLTFQRTTPARLSAVVEAEIERALLGEKSLVEDARLPLTLGAMPA